MFLLRIMFDSKGGIKEIQKQISFLNPTGIRKMRVVDFERRVVACSGYRKDSNIYFYDLNSPLKPSHIFKTSQFDVAKGIAHFILLYKHSNQVLNVGYIGQQSGIRI